MLNVQSRKRGGIASLQTHQTTLSVSWLGRNFRALAIHRGHVQRSWESDPLEGTQHFGALVDQAVAHTGFAGETVSLVLAHPRLAHSFVDIPPAKASALDKLLERTAQQQARSLFSGRAAWSSQPAEAKAGTPRFQLNLFPKALLDELVAGARHANCFLTAVLPTTAVLQNQLLELPAQASQVVMLAAQTGDATTVLVGRSDGQLLLARALAGTWATNLSALALDLRRTALFVNQQHGANVETLYLFGPGVADQLTEIQNQVGIPARVSPRSYHEDYWALEAARLSGRQSQNLISREQQMAPQRRRFAWVAGYAALLLVVLCLAAAFYLHRLRIVEERHLKDWRVQSAALQSRHRELQDRVAEMARQKELVDLVAVRRIPSVPTWLLGYLAQVVPRDLAVTNLVVRKEDDQWRLRISGMLQPGSTNHAGTALAGGVAALTRQLADGPFHVRFDLPGSQAESAPALPAGPPTGITNWISRLNDPSLTSKSAGLTFAIEGRMHP